MVYMSKLTVLNQLLTRYDQLQSHHNTTLQQRLQDVQHWQRQRLHRSHHVLFNQPNNTALAHYFVDRLYGGSEFDDIAFQIQRLVKHAHKVEKIIPETAIQTGVHGIDLAIFAIELDEQVAEYLIENHAPDTPITNDMMRLSYLALEQKDTRLKQMQMADEFGQNLDRYLRSFVIQTAFKMCKSVAYKHNFNTIYDFMQDGFTAMKPLKSASTFVHAFTEQEKHVILNVHAGHLTPFN